MFKKLRQRIIIITMTITTIVLLLAGIFIMVFSSATRPEPKPPVEPFNNGLTEPSQNELNDYIKKDRAEGSQRLLVTLLSVGAVVEVVVFLVVYYLSDKIVAPVKDSYDKQKLFIANASHELKTPLAVIQANMEALDVAKGSEKWKNNIDREITHANQLVLNLLRLARMDAGGSAAAPEKVDLDAEIKERVKLFAPKFGGKINYRDVSKGAEYILPKQDILQVVDILLDNATKYGEKKITVKLDADGIVVSNDGATVAKKDLAKIFDRFYQTDKTREGSGLGLAIAKALCEQNHWKISCESDKGITKFSVSCLNKG